MFVKTPSIHLAHSQLQSTTGRKYSLGWSTRQPVVWHLLWKCMGTISNTTFLLQILPTILFGPYYISHYLSTASHTFNINKFRLIMSVHSLLVAKESTISPLEKNHGMSGIPSNFQLPIIPSLMAAKDSFLPMAAAPWTHSGKGSGALRRWRNLQVWVMNFCYINLNNHETH